MSHLITCQHNYSTYGDQMTELIPVESGPSYSIVADQPARRAKCQCHCHKGNNEHTNATVTS